MNLIVQMTTKIKEMEIDMDKLVQEKETTKEKNVPPTIFLVVTTTVPSTLAEELAPKVPLAIVVPVTSSTTSATESSSTTFEKSDEARKLINAMEDMSIQIKEINR